MKTIEKIIETKDINIRFNLLRAISQEEKQEGLLIAVRNNKYDLISLFIKYGACPNCEKANPLLFSIIHKKEKAFNILIDHGAYITPYISKVILKFGEKDFVQKAFQRRIKNIRKKSTKNNVFIDAQD
jgi:hypothetical protein